MTDRIEEIRADYENISSELTVLPSEYQIGWDDLGFILDTLATREAGMVREWEPIETAPKDGTVVLIAMRNDYGAGAFSVRSGWWMNTGCRPDWSCCISSQKPTHWMPLPPLPEGEK